MNLFEKELKKYGSENVFPLICRRDEETDMVHYGMSLREYYAGLFMQALISNPERYKYIADKVKRGMTNEDASLKNANKAILLADALLEKLIETK